jgi:hypothetical protein
MLKDSKSSDLSSVSLKYSCLHQERYYVLVEWDEEAETYYAFVLDLKSKDFAEPVISLGDSPDDYLNLDYLLKDLSLELYRIGVTDFEVPPSVRLDLDHIMKATLKQSVS